MSDSKAVARCEDALGYARLAASWQPGFAFPVMTGPSLTRYENVLRSEGAELPEVIGTSWPGVVVSLGDPVAHAAAGMLASATSRPHHRVDPAGLYGVLDDFAAVPVALVATAADAARLGDWPGIRHPRFGLVTSRTQESLSCLIYRTLTLSSRAAADDIALIHPRAVGADQADAVALDELRPLLQRPRKALQVLTHGRECCLTLVDGLVCGRGTAAPPVGADLAARTRMPSCLRGEGCWRQELEDEDRIAASSMDVQLAFLQSCDSISVGNNAHPLSVGVALGFLEGTTVAVVGIVGFHIAQRPLFDELAGAIHGGARLGEAVEGLNAACEANREFTRFGLLGDPSLPVDLSAARSAQRRHSTVQEAESVDKELRTQQVILGRLRSLLSLDLPIDERRLGEAERAIRRSLLARGSRQLDTLREVQQSIDEIQAATVHELVREIHGTWWEFLGANARAFRQVSSTPVICPACRRESAVRVELAHRLPVDLTIFTVLCSRCGELSSSTSASSDYEVTADHVVYAPRLRDSELTCTLIGERDWPIHGHAGFAFVAGEIGDLPQGRSRPVSVGPRGTQRERWRFRLGEHVQAAEHYAVVASLIEGEYRYANVFVNTLPLEA
ncbi:hypothetical protein GCM10027160_54130 [Streptomyces calidiresistens]|uniref:CHAT domain-containing protein n=1 Tax=Streptomyces calidiresistens TaxID=1485586 RepID=A0A7W3SZT2_9ACTN|nr:hypothetical protein [Streptomyces calidiresistens]MBB0228011.1 hypothetical protein [Streptomyces calidiresistens]